MSTERPRRCRYCGAALTLAATGRPRWFCSDRHRKAYRRALSADLAGLVCDPRQASAEDELRDLRRELFTLVSRLQGKAMRSELAGDKITCARLAAVAAELGATVTRHFGGGLDSREG